MGQLSHKTRKAIDKMGIKSLPEGYELKGKLFQYRKEGVKVLFHNLVLRPDEVDKYLESIKFRKDHPQELVQVRYIDVKKQQIQYIKMVIYFQYVPINLEQIVTLTYMNMIAVMYFALKGFKVLFEHIGEYFTIQSYMIGINSFGQVKVWLSRNYWQDSPKPSYCYLKAGTKETAEGSMIQELKQIFLCKVDKSTVLGRSQLDGEKFQDLIKSLQEKYGKKQLANNVPTVGELSQSEGSAHEVEKQNVDMNESKVIEVQNPYEDINKVKNCTTTPKIKFNYNKEVSRATILASRNMVTNGRIPKITFNSTRQSANKDSINKASRGSPRKINFSYQKP